MGVFDVYTLPRWEDDTEVEPDPLDVEILTVTAGLVWWSAPTATDDDGDDFDGARLASPIISRT